MAQLTLHGGCVYANTQLKQIANNQINDTIIHNLKKTPFASSEWDNDTVLMLKFNENISAGNFEAENIKYFKIFKKFSNQPKLHHVFTTPIGHIGVIEDFVVGSKCPYTYYIYPVCQAYTDKGEPYDKISSPIISKPFEIQDGIIRVIGLIEDEDNPNEYYIDHNNVWHFSLNLSDTGFSNTMAKSYSDTLHKYPKETMGNGNYRTFSIEGLLGRIDCTTHEYIDTYDDIIEWEQFMSNSQLKMVIDLRGIVTIGNIESNSFKYETTGEHEINVSFNFRQLDDLDNIKIINRQIPANPLHFDVLADNTPVGLLSNAPENKLSYLVVPKG